MKGNFFLSGVRFGFCLSFMFAFSFQLCRFLFSMDRDTIVLVFYNIKAIVSEYLDGIGKDNEQWRHWLFLIS